MFFSPFAVCFVCLAFTSPPSFFSHSSAATIQAFYPQEESKMFRFQCKWYGACEEKHNLSLNREIILCLSECLSPCCSVMASVTKYRADEWLMKPWLVKHKILFAPAQHEQTKSNKRKVTNGLHFERAQLMPGTILGKPCLDWTLLTWHTGSRLDFWLYKQEAQII